MNQNYIKDFLVFQHFRKKLIQFKIRRKLQKMSLPTSLVIGFK